jgi:very-short-patch-repair endonuclease
MHITVQRDHARTLRKNMTPAERKLWNALKSRGLSGYRFNRQVEIGPYIVDFHCRQ